MSWNCYNCDRLLKNRSMYGLVMTEEGQEVKVGTDCSKTIKEAGEDGVFSEANGVNLYSHSGYKAYCEANGETEEQAH